ncbi:LysM peptidoglycan-binding domain-containing protein [Nocardia sp. NEAU-G5]|uniref:LysM peptidoglycan-binding domain-containing protein n=1 Tax=Nocardia albiluteola TaxID=2842303 RepID=A0ABS6B8R5_9NOCA|nr:LysM peptidoglycan-binding domain-containing protein [Nocardia albiluteola]MBU3065816.1 LysM peptidoglycan-binding domain-containing protein [Nocardia albiluteola]
MRTTISEFDVTTTDPARVAAPRGFRPSGPAARPAGAARGVGARRPGPARPASAGVRYGHAQVRASRVPHPAVQVERARFGLASLALAALLSAAAVCGLLELGQLRSGVVAAPQTTVVQVREGEPLSEVAARVAPGVPVQDTVRKIMQLNALQGAQVASGSTLIVPVSGR